MPNAIHSLLHSGKTKFALLWLCSDNSTSRAASRNTRTESLSRWLRRASSNHTLVRGMVADAMPAPKGALPPPSDELREAPGTGVPMTPIEVAPGVPATLTTEEVPS